MRRASRKSGRHFGGVIATALALSLVASACGGTTAEDADGENETLSEIGLTAADGESGLDEAGEPQRGGTLVYGVEADSSGGYCLPRASSPSPACSSSERSTTR